MTHPASFGLWPLILRTVEQDLLPQVQSRQGENGGHYLVRRATIWVGCTGAIKMPTATAAVAPNALPCIGPTEVASVGRRS